MPYDHHLNDPAPLATPRRRSGGLATAARFSPAAPKLAANTSSPLWSAGFPPAWPAPPTRTCALHTRNAGSGDPAYTEPVGRVPSRGGASPLPPGAEISEPVATAKPVGNRRSSLLDAAVAQVGNLPYRRIVFGRPPASQAASHSTTPGRLQICATAECNSALPVNRPAPAAGGSADWQSAVSPVGNRWSADILVGVDGEERQHADRNVGAPQDGQEHHPAAAGGFAGAAECHSAKQPIANRRYAAAVAQVSNLPYRRIVFGRPPASQAASHSATPGRLQICATAECNSALRGSRRSSLLAALALLALTHAASAATVLWTGAGDGVAWNQAANWSNNVLPTASSDVVISGVGTKVTITR